MTRQHADQSERLSAIIQGGMALTLLQIDRYIALLEEFEQLYGEFLTERHNQAVTGERRWSGEEWAGRARRLRSLAPRAEAAMEASGLGAYELHWPQGIGGGVMSDDLSSLIFEFKDFAGFSVDARDDDLQMAILDRIPSQIEALRMRREEAEEASREKGRRLRKVFSSSRAERRWLHDPNPWVLGIGVGLFVTIVGGIVVALIVSA